MRKPMLHACYDIHVRKQKRAPVYVKQWDPRRGYTAWADTTLCGVNVEDVYWRRKRVKISESLCPRMVTCKRCVASLNKYKREKKPK